MDEILQSSIKSVIRNRGHEKYEFTNYGDDFTKNLNFDTESFLSELQIKIFSCNKNTRMNYHNFKNLFIPSEDINKLLAKIENMGYTIHMNQKTLYFFKGNTELCVFSNSSTGYSCGQLQYSNNVNVSELISVIENFSSKQSKIEIKW